MNPLEYTIELPRKSEKLHLTTDHIETLLKYDIKKETNKKRIDYFKNIQELIKINRVIGLRINELLYIERDDIIFKGDYVSMKVTEEKTGETRTVVVKDSQAIQSIKLFYNNGREQPFNVMDYTRFNYHLKSLAKQAELTEAIILKKSVGREIKPVTKALDRIISSHAIRRYAIQNNLVNYGIVLTRQLSGHKDYQMIEKHYSRNLKEQEMLELLNKTKT